VKTRAPEAGIHATITQLPDFQLQSPRTRLNDRRDEGLHAISRWWSSRIAGRSKRCRLLESEEQEITARGETMDCLGAIGAKQCMS
jgi:hypothetical protein